MNEKVIELKDIGRKHYVPERFLGYLDVVNGSNSVLARLNGQTAEIFSQRFSEEDLMKLGLVNPSDFKHSLNNWRERYCFQDENPASRIQVLAYFLYSHHIASFLKNEGKFNIRKRNLENFGAYPYSDEQDPKTYPIEKVIEGLEKIVLNLLNLESNKTEFQKELKRKDIKDLWAAYDGNRDDIGLRNKLIEFYKPFLDKHIAWTMYYRFNGVLNVANVKEAIISGAGFGILDAVEKFDPKRGIKFETYARQRINGAIRDAIREIDQTPRLTRDRRKLIEEARDREFRVSGKRPNENTLEGLNLSETKILENEIIWRVYNQASIGESNDPDNFGNNRSIDPSTIQFKGKGPMDIASDKDAFEKLLKDLPEDRAQIIRYYYDEGLTLSEIGKIMGISESRTSQIMTETRKIMKSILTRPKIK